jgi:palmitoyl-protein thioesterase
LPDINNALPVKNDTYKQHMLELNNLVLVMFTEDEMVQPKESEQFGFYVPGQDKQVRRLNSQ